MKTGWLAAWAALVLAGCGHGGGAAAGGGATALNGGWKATDACALLNKSVVAATLSSPVTSSELGAVHDGANGGDLYSQCVFKLADSRMLVFGTTQTAADASLKEQQDKLLGQLSMVSDNKPATIAGLGQATYWLPDMHMMYTFLGDGRLASLTLTRFDFTKPRLEPDAIKADEIALMRKIGA